MRKKEKCLEEKVRVINDLQKLRKNYMALNISDLCDSSIDNQIFNTEVLHSIENAPVHTDMRSDYSLNATLLQNNHERGHRKCRRKESEKRISISDSRSMEVPSFDQYISMFSDIVQEIGAEEAPWPKVKSKFCPKKTGDKVSNFYLWFYFWKFFIRLYHLITWCSFRWTKSVVINQKNLKMLLKGGLKIQK